MRNRKLFRVCLIAASLVAPVSVGAQDAESMLPGLMQSEAPQPEEPPQTEVPPVETPQTDPPQTEAPQTEVLNTPSPAPPQTEAPNPAPPQTEVPNPTLPQTEASTPAPTQTETPKQTPTLPQTEAPKPESPQVTAMPEPTSSPAAVTPIPETPQTELDSEQAQEESAEVVELSIPETQKEETLEDAQEAPPESEAEEEKKEGKKVSYNINPSAYPAANVNDVTMTLYKTLRNDFGLNHAAACGILANAHMESCFNPRAVGDGGSSYGVFQWHNERLTRLINHCSANGLDQNTLEGQISYLKHELNGYYASVFNYVKSVPDTPQGAYDAAHYWCIHFEAPAQMYARAAQRGNLARAEYFPNKNLTIGEKSIADTIKEIRENMEEMGYTKKRTPSDSTQNLRKEVRTRSSMRGADKL